MANHPQHHGSDKSAAFTGLVVAVVFLLAVVLTIVSLTNKKYAHEGGETAAAPAAAATH
jgi:hypothetical protein